MNKTQKNQIKDMNTHASDPLLNLSAVAEALGRDPSTIGRWVKEGVLPSVPTPSGLMKVRKSVLQKWLNATDIGKQKGVQARVSRLKQDGSEPELELESETDSQAESESDQEPNSELESTTSPETSEVNHGS